MSPPQKPDPFGAADCLSVAAAPTFAMMALVTALGGGPLDLICWASPFGGMLPMYVLMSVFHAGPWLRLISLTRRALACAAAPKDFTSRREPEADGVVGATRASP
jgi:hypothetical protein